MIISLVPHNKGEKLTKAAVSAGSGGGTVLMGRALACSNFAAILGVGETTRDLIYTIVDSNKKNFIINAITESLQNEKSSFGFLFTLKVDSLIKAKYNSNKNNFPEDNMSDNPQTQADKAQPAHDMITVIVNKGYADDVMFAARKAGATGGTVINARGTARETDAKFFGVHIVPEKDMLLIIVEHAKKEAVLNAISQVKCLKEPGMGIAFTSEVSDFTMLGKKKE